MNTPDLNAAAEAAATAREVCRRAAVHLAELSSEDGRISVGKLDRHQVLAYDLAHATAGIEGAAVMCEYGNHGGLQARLACLFTAEAISDLVARLVGREAEWGVSAMDLAPAGEFVNAHRAPEFLEDVAEEIAKHGGGPAHLAEEFELVRDTFHRFAADKVRPVAEHVHRKNEDIPEDVITGLAEIGGFGLSVPEEYGGFAAGGESDYLGMVIATEELSWGSLNVGGSLITRPEILTRALVRGGTEDQKKDWLPRIAAGEAMVGVMVTEPDYGSDVANLKASATKVDGGYKINGVKTWATFAGRANTLMLLARTDPDKSKGHKGLSLFIVEKPEAPGHHFEFSQESGGKMEGRAIDTLGYRGMHSFEVAFEDWLVPEANLIGGEGGLGKGFYYQMEGFENGRLQTAARAVGVMQAAYEAALDYARERQRLRQVDLRVPADQGEAGQDGRRHPGRPPVRLLRRPAHGQGRRGAGSVDGQGLRLPGGRVGHPRSACRSTAAWATPKSSVSPATSSTPGSCRSSKAPTRRCACGSSPAASPSRPSRRRRELVKDVFARAVTTLHTAGLPADGRQARRQGGARPPWACSPPPAAERPAPHHAAQHHGRRRPVAPRRLLWRRRPAIPSGSGTSRPTRRRRSRSAPRPSPVGPPSPPPRRRRRSGPRPSAPTRATTATSARRLATSPSSS